MRMLQPPRSQAFSAPGRPHELALADQDAALPTLVVPVSSKSGNARSATVRASSAPSHVQSEEGAFEQDERLEPPVACRLRPPPERPASTTSVRASSPASKRAPRQRRQEPPPCRLLRLEERGRAPEQVHGGRRVASARARPPAAARRSAVRRASARARSSTGPSSSVPERLLGRW